MTRTRVLVNYFNNLKEIFNRGIMSEMILEMNDYEEIAIETPWTSRKNVSIFNTIYE